MDAGRVAGYSLSSCSAMTMTAMMAMSRTINSRATIAGYSSALPPKIARHQAGALY